MLQTFFDAVPAIITSLFNLETLLCIILGVVGGMFIGALPGLSATMGIALMLPFTYGLSAISAIAMLMTIYTSAICGGSITAILIHTPGTPSSAATALDGFPLTKQGKGLQALGVSISASMIGGTVSAVALLFLASLLASAALKFGSMEYFLLACLGLSVIASLASESLVKGLLAGCLGLVLGCIGIDASSGYARYTFGIVPLLWGIPTVPALIGLFSIPQVLDQLENARKQGKTVNLADTAQMSGKVLLPWKEYKKLLPTILRSSVIGVFAGILPGAGGEIGSWMAYNTAKNRSKNKELFGKGSFEGVAASEAGNNAVTGGACIPMMTLGIPGSAAAAVLMGGLMIHGLQPGADLFVKKASTTYAIIFGFMLANIMMGIIGLFIARYIVRITKVPVNILCPIIVVLAVVGSYAISSDMYNIYIMIIFGLIGYFMRMAKFPPAAMVLGFLLGHMAEKGLRHAVNLSRGNLLSYYLHRPISLVITALIVVGIFLPMVLEKIKASRSEMKQEQD